MYIFSSNVKNISEQTQNRFKRDSNKKGYVIMKFNKKITAFLLAIVVCITVSLSAFASGIMGGAGFNGSSSDSGFSGTNGTSLTDSMKPRADRDDENNSTLGDIDGDGVIENENGLMPGYTDRNNSRKNEMNSREGTEPISEGTVTSENGTSDTATDSAMSWTAIIVAVLLAAALVAVVIALIPKRRDDR